MSTKDVILIRFEQSASRWLRRRAKTLKISIAEVVRRIVDEKRDTK